MTNLVPVADIKVMAEAVARSGLFGVKTAEQAMALMLIAQAEGMHPAIAARDYHVVQGRPVLKADAMLARFQSAGGKVSWTDYTDSKVTGTFSHPAGGSITISWTFEQARSIGLTNKDNWRNYPRAMLRSRCVSEGIRAIYPGIIVGTYTDEETESFNDRPRVTEHVVEAVVEEDNGTPLMLPNGQIHARYAEESWWAQAYADLRKRIQNSAKLSDAEKETKMTELADANAEVLQALSATDLELANNG